jgi:2-polyprenyl-3-methyl-5-hydroxy-6-metoxy-1,4-benzoquinol methylase
MDRLQFTRYASHQAVIVDKDDFIVSRCTGKRVLDLGCIGHGVERARRQAEKFLHKRIRDAAAACTGVDLLREDAAILNAEGYNIVVADVETLALGTTFDTVVAGDLIEHLSNHGLFLNRVREHMRADSEFIVSTPNPLSFEQAMTAVFENSVAVNPEHTCWFDPTTLYQLLDRHRFDIVDFQWVRTAFSYPLTVSAARFVVNPLTRLVQRHRPRCRADFLVVCRLRA